MKDEQLTEALKKFPCPSCGTVGHLELHQMSLRLIYKGQEVLSEGEGSICHACNMKFMDEKLTESIANQVQRIDGDHKYIEIHRNIGELEGHTLN